MMQISGKDFIHTRLVLESGEGRHHESYKNRVDMYELCSPIFECRFKVDPLRLGECFAKTRSICYSGFAKLRSSGKALCINPNISVQVTCITSMNNKFKLGPFVPWHRLTAKFRWMHIVITLPTLYQFFTPWNHIKHFMSFSIKSINTYNL